MTDTAHPFDLKNDIAAGASGERGPIKPANQRNMARLSAVQALYQMDINGHGVGQTIAEFKTHRLGQELDGDAYRPADGGWFTLLVEGVVEHQRQIDPLVDQTLKEGWPLRRIDLTLRALLRAGVFELLHRKDVPGRVVVNEYVELSRGFFNAEEPGIVNGVLDRLGRHHRADDFPNAPPAPGPQTDLGAPLATPIKSSTDKAAEGDLPSKPGLAPTAE